LVELPLRHPQLFRKVCHEGLVFEALMLSWWP
jgi:hypothetical protein